MPQDRGSHHLSYEWEDESSHYLDDTAEGGWPSESRLDAALFARWEDRGYPCTEDCSGHEAGYEWAADNGISNPYDCSGNSRSFVEGCMAFAEGSW